MLYSQFAVNKEEFLNTGTLTLCLNELLNEIDGPNNIGLSVIDGTYSSGKAVLLTIYTDSSRRVCAEEVSFEDVAEWVTNAINSGCDIILKDITSEVDVQINWQLTGAVSHYTKEANPIAK